MKSKRAMGALPFSNTVGDSLDLMKKMWGMTGLPGIPSPGNLASMAVRIPQQLPSMLAPTLDVNELERRINDLRAVEQWLELNASMLRTTIQSLEVQRATISTLKGLGGAMLSPMSYMNGGKAAAAPAETPPEVALGIAAMREQEQAAIKRRKRAAKKRAKAAHPPTVADAPLNPAAWWNTLQDQFTKIASAATATPEEPKEQSAAKPARKTTRSRRAAKRRKASPES
jgi:hypothetical protein